MHEHAADWERVDLTQLQRACLAAVHRGSASQWQRPRKMRELKSSGRRFSARPCNPSLVVALSSPAMAAEAISIGLGLSMLTPA